MSRGGTTERIVHNNGVCSEVRMMRQMLAWQLRIQGRTLQDILCAFQNTGLGTCSLPQISNYIREEGERLAEAHKDAALAIKMEQHQRYDFIISEALAAWERSKAPSEVVSQISGRVHVPNIPPVRGFPDLPLPTEDDLIALPDQVTRTVAGQTGNPAYLAQAMAAMKAQAALWGIEAPKKTDVTSGGQQIKAYVGVDPDVV